MIFTLKIINPFNKLNVSIDIPQVVGADDSELRSSQASPSPLAAAQVILVCFQQQLASPV
jgi:hypothetical protein